MKELGKEKCSDFVVMMLYLLFDCSGGGKSSFIQVPSCC
jgi:hypothetical protein